MIAGNKASLEKRKSPSIRRRAEGSTCSRVAMRGSLETLALDYKGR